MSNPNDTLLNRINDSVQKAVGKNNWKLLTEQQVIDWCVSTVKNRINFRENGKIRRDRATKALELLKKQGVDITKL